MKLENEDFKITPETTFIRGLWIDLGSSMEKDSGWRRIEWLLENCLELVMEKDVESGSLYRNPEDGKLWHLFLAAPELGQNSPPSLELIDADRGKELFGDF